MTPSWRVPSGDVPTKRRSRRLVPVLLVAVVGLGVGIYVAARHAPQILGETGCTAGAGRSAVALDPEQAQIAATIAGVAHQRGHAVPRGHRGLRRRHAGDASAQPGLRGPGLGRRLPAAAIRRLGPASKLINPVYASAKFFQALAQRPRLPAAAGVQGGPGGAAQRGRLRLRPVPAHGGQADRGLHRSGAAGGLVLAPWEQRPRGPAQFSAARRALVQTFGQPARAQLRLVAATRRPCWCGPRKRTSAGRWRPGW